MSEARPELAAPLEAIDEVAIRRLAMPLEPPIRSGIHEISGIHTVVVQARSGEEVGVGYALAFTANESRAVAALAEDLVTEVLADPSRGVRAHWGQMWDHLNFIGHEGPGVMAMAAIDTALWDLLARQARQPL